MRLEAVGKRYGLRQPWVVRDVSLEVPAGSLIRVEGGNGTGKSTLLRVLAGVSLPSTGRVTGRPRTGYVPERFPPGLPFTAHDYLMHLGRVHGLGGRTLAARIGDCLGRLGAAGDAGLPLRVMSKGMCQKVAVAQALLARPGLLVLDEAWTGLDQAARGALEGAVRERLADGARVIFVDHDPQRLAGLVSARWQIRGDRVQAAAGPAPRPAAGGRVMVIRLTGASPGLRAALSRLAGVHSVGAEAGQVTVRTGAGAADEALRLALAEPGVHVVAVGEDEGSAGCGH